MDAKQEKFMQELLADFKTEAAEHLQIYLNGLLALEKNPVSEVTKKTVEEIFREIHSAKGAARAVNLPEIERVCQSLESALASLKAGRIMLSPALLDLLHQAGDLLEIMFNDLSSGSRSLKGDDTLKMICLLTDAAQGIIAEPNKKTESLDLHTQTDPLTKVSNTGNESVVQPPVSDTRLQQETVRVSVEKLRNLMMQAEEFIAAKSMYKYFSNELSEITHSNYNFWKMTEARMKEVDPGPESEYYRWEDIRRWHKENGRELHEHLSRLQGLFSQYQHNTSRMVDDMLLGVRKTLLIPFSAVLDLLPRMVRDIAKDSGKEVTLTINGGATEIDRRILEEMKDPLIHIIRNCIDHGIEKPDIRQNKGKPNHGSIDIRVTKPREREVELIISDDGGGIDPTKVIQSAVKSGIISFEAAQRLSTDDALKLVFQSGVSTSSMITELSGRGLGLAIVNDKINRLGGHVIIESKPGDGTRFTLVLPLTLATFTGILIRIGEHLVMLPLNTVKRAIRIEKNQIKIIENQETLLFEEHHLALVRMADALGFPSSRIKESTKYHYIVIFSAGKNNMAFVVDEILGEQEGIIKPLGGQLLKVRNVSGATVLGDGRIVPVIDVPELLESVSQTNLSVAMPQAEEDGTLERKSQRILVAEDSLTSRSLIRNLLESAGYEVVTAVDGWQGYTLLKQGSFDLVVSDIEMPRMNGFELTAKIRSEPDLSSLPVILVTALESPEDHKRGMEAGASAYITKGTFEGKNLVATIQRLI